jgi:hypothetical protein
MNYILQEQTSYKYVALIETEENKVLAGMGAVNPDDFDGHEVALEVGSSIWPHCPAPIIAL